MNWEPVYALLILFSTVTTFACGILIERKEGKQRKAFLTLCLIANLAILFTYKYLNFATESIFAMLAWMGIRMEVPHFELLLPVGISFYTFQAIGYTIDVYHKSIEAEKNIFTYALFVAFFPQLVAGPIERAKNILPQFKTSHHFNGETFIEGLKLMIWGYFMKLCIAENVASYVDAVFNNLPAHNGTSVWMASFFFTFQIYCDFCGYSLIAIGAAKCMDYKLMQNFNRPYLSRSLKEFWRRWHISLSTWFMDYIYFPLGGSRCSEHKHYRNLIITMLVSGVWHGANWTFICWGGLHGVLLSLSTLRLKLWGQSQRFFVAIGEVLLTFFLALIGWVFFRANTISDAFLALQKMFTQPGMLFNGEGKPSIALPILLILMMMFKELKDELKWNAHFMHNKHTLIAWTSTAAMIVLILLCARFEGGQFIYFQF